LVENVVGYFLNKQNQNMIVHLLAVCCKTAKNKKMPQNISDRIDWRG
jgi:hypothetical protein